MIRGTMKFNGIAVGEFSVSFLGPTIKMVAKAAFVSPDSAAAHGWTEGTQWQPDTMAKLNELRALMERDLGLIHFVSGTEVRGDTRVPVSQAVGGLAEHLQQDSDAPSV